jgi:predicted N-acetyltransferase YhbS
MPDQISVRPARPDDYEAILQVKSLAFGYTRQAWYGAYPYTRPELWSPEYAAVVEEQGRVVSHVSLYPLEFLAGGSRVEAVGVTGVATLPECKGRGHMSRLFAYWHEWMAERRMPLALLWGMTGRYRHFGYEPAGRQIVFTLSAATTQAAMPTSPPRSYDPGRDLHAIVAMHERQAWRTLRSRPDYELHLLLPHLRVWMSGPGEPPAYVVMRGREAIEYGGDLAAVQGVLAYLLANHSLGQVDLCVPYGDGEAVAATFEASQDWRIGPSAMWRVVDLAGALAACDAQVQQRAQAAGISAGTSLTLRMTDSGQAATIIVGECARPGDGGTHTVSLPDRAIARLLLGPWRPANPEGLLAVFPLDLHVWQLDHR